MRPAGDAGDAWDPGRYTRFREERTQPFRDLLDGVAPLPGGRAIDLGCGTGDLTAVLHERVRAAETLGVDRSAAMLAGAPSAPGLRFARADLAEFEPERTFDLVFSNAALQWLPDHEVLFARIRDWVAPRGRLAVQVPANHGHPSHVLASRVASEEFGARARTPHVLAPERYAVLLDELDFAGVRVELRVYLHHLESRDGVFDWVQGTLLNAFRNEVDDFEAFARRYREVLLAALPDKRPFPFTFPRILLWATRP